MFGILNLPFDKDIRHIYSFHTDRNTERAGYCRDPTSISQRAQPRSLQTMHSDDGWVRFISRPNLNRQEAFTHKVRPDMADCCRDSKVHSHQSCLDEGLFKPVSVWIGSVGEESDNWTHVDPLKIQIKCKPNTTSLDSHARKFIFCFIGYSNSNGIIVY